MVVLGGGAAGAVALSQRAAAAPTVYDAGELTYDALKLNKVDAVSLTGTFRHDVVISWGDPVVPGAAAFDIDKQSESSQAAQFGFNNDWIGYYPLPGYDSADSTRGLLFVNHEYTSANMMFPDVTYIDFDSIGATSDEQKRIEIQAHGASVVEVSLDESTGTWSYEQSSRYNRRITATTRMKITGPVAGNVHLRTNADPEGTKVLGMLNNCGGGTTPWGTALTAEENFDQYFSNRSLLDPAGDPLKQYAKANASVFGIPAGPSNRGWELVDPRFDMTKEWNEPFRFGWIVEIDPYDPKDVPKKRTALGRFKHEAAAGVKAKSDEYVVYMGDDQVGQCIYKFVSNGRVKKQRQANTTLLDKGTLYVATFKSDGTGTWSPLTFGSGPLVSPAFSDQADVLIRTRTAAVALGGTPMDRPEDVEVSPKTGYIYAAMTGSARSAADAANPRVSNAKTDPNSSRGGHIIEIREDADDHTSTTFSWEIFILCGVPEVEGTLDSQTQPAAANSSGRTYFAGFDESQVSPIARPDNVAFDSFGNLWITTDGMPSAAERGGLGKNDSIYGVPTVDAERGHLKALCSGPLGAEMTGPYFTPDDATLFAAIQHPGEDGNIQAPQSTWNSVTAVNAGKCSRNGVIAIRRNDGTSIPFGTGPEAAAAASLGMSALPAPVVGAAALVGGLVAFRARRMGHPSAG